MSLNLDLDLLREQLADFLLSPGGLATVALALLVYGFAICRIFAKAGFWAPLGLFLSVPPLILLLPLFLAFAPWPVRGQLRRFRRLEKLMRKEEIRDERRRSAA